MKHEIANWGNYPVVTADEFLPSFRSEIPSLLQQKTEWVARGNGRCYGDASLAENVITTTNLKRIIDFDHELGIVNCEAGVMLDQLLEVIVPHGWFLPVTPGTKFITIGGAVASDIHGKNHHVDGSFSNHIVSMQLMLADGSLLLCSATEHPDLFWATCGGMGLTGIITTVRFRLKKIETSYIKQLQLKARNLEEILDMFEQYKHYTYSVAWIDCVKQGKGMGRSILMLGEHASLHDLSEKQKRKPLQVFNKSLFTFPFNLPSISLNKFTIGVFNTLFYAKNTRKEIHNVIPYDPFFYPLDAIFDWNKMYGKAGFVQYQFVLPMHARKAMVDIFNRIASKGFASFLAVLKTFGQQDSMIGFPMEGFTLALDIPIRPGLFEFLDELDAIVLANGGRIYLSKDARMKAEMFKKSYPHIGEFVNVLKQYNSAGRINSALGERLGLSGQSH
ncbi:MAG TPA: FAD-binding oxidoreductase [Phnomibacter sp.]|nr:FAD-binding oxidoreductase [Phnomibacter sp.]